MNRRAREPDLAKSWRRTAHPRSLQRRTHQIRFTASNNSGKSARSASHRPVRIDPPCPHDKGGLRARAGGSEFRQREKGLPPSRPARVGARSDRALSLDSDIKERWSGGVTPPWSRGNPPSTKGIIRKSFLNVKVAFGAQMRTISMTYATFSDRLTQAHRPDVRRASIGPIRP